jgi:hypothetical protein
MSGRILTVGAEMGEKGGGKGGTKTHKRDNARNRNTDEP